MLAINEHSWNKFSYLRDSIYNEILLEKLESKPNKEKIEELKKKYDHINKRYESLEIHTCNHIIVHMHSGYWQCVNCGLSSRHSSSFWESYRFEVYQAWQELTFKMRKYLFNEKCSYDYEYINSIYEEAMERVSNPFNRDEVCNLMNQIIEERNELTRKNKNIFLNY